MYLASDTMEDWTHQICYSNQSKKKKTEFKPAVHHLKIHMVVQVG